MKPKIWIGKWLDYDRWFIVVAQNRAEAISMADSEAEPDARTIIEITDANGLMVSFLPRLVDSEEDNDKLVDCNPYDPNHDEPDFTYPIISSDMVGDAYNDHIKKHLLNPLAPVVESPTDPIDREVAKRMGIVQKEVIEAYKGEK